MSRSPAEITRIAAINIAKWKVAELCKQPGTPMLTRFALQTALKGDAVEQIADVLYGSGLKLTIDLNDPAHKSWLESGAVKLEEA